MATTQVGNVIFTIAADIKGVSSQLRTLENNFKGSFGRIETVTQRLNRSLGGIGGLLGVSFGVAGIKSFASSILDATIATERAINALKVVAGDSQTAANEFAFITAESKRLGLNLESAAQQYSSLAAASKGTALQGEETRRIFVAVSEAATVLGLSADQTGGALVAIQQIISKGRVSAEELRQQLGERLPGAFQLAARAMGVTTAELDKMLRAGAIAAEDLLPKLATELNNTFGPGVAGAVNSVQAQINRLNTAWFELKNTIGDAGFIKALTTLFQGWTASIGAAVRMMERLSGVADRLNKDRAANLAETVRALREQFEQMQRAPLTPTLDAAMRANIEQRKKLLEELAGLGSEVDKSGLIPAGPTAAPVVEVDTKSLKKSENDIRSFFDGLRKQIDQTRDKITEGLFGEDAALEEQLDRTFATFKEAFAREFPKLKLPAGLEQQFETYKARIIAANKELRATNAELEAIEAAGQRASQDSAEWLNYAADVAKITQAAQEAEEALKKLAFEQSPFGKTLAAFDALDTEEQKTRDDEESRQKALSKAIADLNDQQRDAAVLAAVFGDASTLVAQQLEAQRQKVEALVEKFGALSPEVAAAVAEFERLQELETVADTAEQLIRGAARGITDNLRSVAQGTQTVEEAFKNMGVSAVTALADVIFQLTVIEPLIRSVRAALQGGGGGGGGGFLGGLFSTIAGGLLGSSVPNLNSGGFSFETGGAFSQIPFRAAGGPVEAGKLYRVNENRTEFFKPSMSGSVLPLAPSAGGGGPSLHIGYMDFRGAERGVSHEVRRAIEQSRRMAVSESVSTVRDNRQRSNSWAKTFA